MVRRTWADQRAPAEEGDRGGRFSFRDASQKRGAIPTLLRSVAKRRLVQSYAPARGRRAAPLALGAARQEFGVEPPRQVRRELLRRSCAGRSGPATGSASGRSCGCRYRCARDRCGRTACLRPGTAPAPAPTVPVRFVAPRSPARLVAAGNDTRRAQLGRDVAQIEVGRADEHRQREARSAGHFLRQLHRQVIGVQADAAVPRMAAPRRLADDVTIAAQRLLGQLDHAGPIEVRPPEQVAVEDALVVVGAALVVPMERPQAVNRLPSGGDLRGVQDAGQQDEAILVQGGAPGRPDRDGEEGKGSSNGSRTWRSPLWQGESTLLCPTRRTRGGVGDRNFFRPRMEATPHDGYHRTRTEDRPSCTTRRRSNGRPISTAGTPATARPATSCWPPRPSACATWPARCSTRTFVVCAAGRIAATWCRMSFCASAAALMSCGRAPRESSSVLRPCRCGASCSTWPGTISARRGRTPASFGRSPRGGDARVRCRQQSGAGPPGDVERVSSAHRRPAGRGPRDVRSAVVSGPDAGRGRGDPGRVGPHRQAPLADGASAAASFPARRSAGLRWWTVPSPLPRWGIGIYTSPRGHL